MAENQTKLSDNLDVQRTRLAEERTHLAYIRTGMTIIMGGLFFIGYFPSGSPFSFIGYLAVFLGVASLVYGFYSHRKTHQAIKRLTLGAVDMDKDDP